MVYNYKGHYPYSSDVVEGWDSTAMGVYYCGYVNSQGVLCVVYVGVGTGDEGMRGRLIDHLREDYWPDATHFGYSVCDSERDALDHETKEIARLQPKYNKKGK